MKPTVVPAIPRQYRPRRPVTAETSHELSRRELPKDALEYFDALRARDDDPKYADAPILDVYARISINRDDETEKTDTQIIDMLRGMLRRNCRLGKVFRDDNLSAWKKNGKRPGWNATLGRVEGREVHGVFVVHIDRYLRQPRQLERLIDASEAGSLVWSLYADYDFSKAQDRYIARGMVSQADMQSAETSRRAKARNAHKREEGKGHSGQRGFGAPSGARARVQIPAEQVQREREAILWGIEAYLDRGTTFADIAREWQARGFTQITSVHVREVFKQPRIAGLMEHEGRLVPRVDVEAIISRDRFERLSSTLRSRKPGRQPTTGQSITGGVLLCGYCGAALFRKHSGEGRVQYRCPTRTGCGRTSVKASDVEELLRERTIVRLFSPQHAETVAAQGHRLAQARDRLAMETERLKSAATRYVKGDLTEIEYDIIRPALVEAVANAQHNVDALELAGAPTESTLLDETRETLVARWDTADPAGKGRMVREAFRRIVVQPAASTRTPASERLVFEDWTD